MNISIINLLLKIKNATINQKEIVTINFNSLYIDLLKKLYKQGFIQYFKIQKTIGSSTNSFEITINLRYLYGKPVFSDLKIFSTPSKIKYLKLKNIYKLTDKKTVFFFFTNKGLLTDFECKKKKTGGILLFGCY
jgi:small subunit ribosomal protein S8